MAVTGSTSFAQPNGLCKYLKTPPSLDLAPRIKQQLGCTICLCILQHGICTNQ